jgi:hypothetical protein
VLSLNVFDTAAELILFLNVVVSLYGIVHSIAHDLFLFSMFCQAGLM